MGLLLGSSAAVASSALNTQPFASPNVFGVNESLITNGSATYEITGYSPANASSRWGFMDGGAYVFSAIGADAGDYTATIQVNNYKGTGEYLTFDHTITVS